MTPNELNDHMESHGDRLNRLNIETNKEIIAEINAAIADWQDFYWGQYDEWDLTKMPEWDSLSTDIASRMTELEALAPSDATYVEPDVDPDIIPIVLPDHHVTGQVPDTEPVPDPEPVTTHTPAPQQTVGPTDAPSKPFPWLRYGAYAAIAFGGYKLFLSPSKST